MLLVRTRVQPSRIAGLGLFAAEAVAAGEPVWRFEPGIDLLLEPDRVAALPAAFRDFLDRYAYESRDFPGRIVVSGDHAKFMNHSDSANTRNDGLVSYAARAIADGEEITCDYRAFAVGWNGFGPG